MNFILNNIEITKQKSFFDIFFFWKMSHNLWFIQMDSRLFKVVIIENKLN